MLIILPVSSVDAHLAVELAGWIAELGGCAKHHVHCLFDASTDTESQVKIAGSLIDCFESLDMTEMMAPGGWPIAPNFMFRQAALIAESRGLPWWFFEADNTPTRRGWLDECQQAYYDGKKPFFGAVEKHWLGRPGNRIADGEYLMGSAIYPSNLRTFTRRHLYPSEIPFDVSLRYDILSKTKPTDLIQNCWRTQNFREDGDTIICDAAPGREGQTSESLNRRVNPAAAVVHGCKDLSLLLLKRRALAHA